ncbi:ABC transporter substrate-binding protein [Bifidobacterium psychraerophilum]|uniref:ABC transporter, solute-binding protein n=1 Tax=Bifidobacterium psychraerophilum TaxID=218140 RepID=A0A087CJ73_9BIFI|nr:sugar ABC transporter substrate-binding protein [Bifidobacterium psychraerophilum]KFI83323.1 ABC transporter, solute-binding protein [Bifidobacterium psychraerophilum]PKA94377.1 multiple sugar transport system substrate-binding protein [Bifidobacterium psychraerophilum DSM 22366]
MKSLTKMIAGGLSAVMLFSAAACGGSSGEAADGSSGQKVTLNVWGWEPLLKDVADAFEKENPNITIKITNAGTATDQYTALNNAISAGSGAPDVAQVEYYATAQYALSDSLKDLSEFGAKDYSDFYTPGPWSSVNINDKIYGLPLDSGPMAMFYNKEIFDKAGVTSAPTTMEEYYEAAKKIHALGSDYYITADSGEPAPEELMIWAAGGTPFKVDGENLTINLTDDAGTQEFAKWWQKLVDEGLIDTKTKRWSDDWSRKLNEGNIASLTIGAWMASMLDDQAPDGSGKWRVANTPTFDTKATNGEDGGSTLAIMSSTDKAEAAWKFIDFAAHGKGVKIRVDKGQFPADKASLSDSSFLTKTDPYFGDQKYNEVLSKAADDVNTKWQFLPYDVYARSIFSDTAGQATLGKITFKEALKNWQDQLVEYGKQQGYKVNE